MTRRRGALAAALLLAFLTICALGYRNATALPVVRTLNVPLRGYPAGAAPVRVVLFSDLHVHGPDTPPARIGKVVEEINGLHPDIVIAAGDYVGANWFGRHYSPEEAIAPLARLKARLGVYAVLGNHDTEAGTAGVADALQHAGVRVLVNEAIAVGPLAIAGIDGHLLKTGKQWQARRQRVHAALERLPGAKIVVAHRPDEGYWVPGWVPLVLAGHTHCGQVVLPLIGPLQTGSDFGTRYLCGAIREGPRLVVVTAGVGTSKIPFRLGAPPDLWLLELSAPAGAR